jgi:hypothetical protein
LFAPEKYAWVSESVQNIVIFPSYRGTKISMPYQRQHDLTLSNDVTRINLDQRSSKGLQLPLCLHAMLLVFHPRLHDVINHRLVESLNIRKERRPFSLMLLAHRFGHFLVLVEYAGDVFADFFEFLVQSGNFGFRVVGQLCHLLHAVAELDVSASDAAVGSTDADSQDIFAERSGESSVVLCVLGCTKAVERLAVDAYVFKPRSELVVYGVELFDYGAAVILSVD